MSLVTNPEPSRGMFSSIQVGLAACGGPVTAVLPADMPFVPSSIVNEVLSLSESSGEVIVPVFGGQRGHPIGIPARYRDVLLTVPAESNLKAALRAVTGRIPRELEVENAGVLRDVDVPADLNT